MVLAAGGNRTSDSMQNSRGNKYNTVQETETNRMNGQGNRVNTQEFKGRGTQGAGNNGVCDGDCEDSETVSE
jgi:hypothetical protein